MEPYSDPASLTGGFSGYRGTSIPFNKVLDVDNDTSVSQRIMLAVVLGRQSGGRAGTILAGAAGSNRILKQVE